MKKKLPAIFYVLIAASLIGCSMPNTAEPIESVDNAAVHLTSFLFLIHSENCIGLQSKQFRKAAPCCLNAVHKNLPEKKSYLNKNQLRLRIQSYQKLFYRKEGTD